MSSVQSLENHSDADLLRRSLAGEERAFHLLYQRLKGGIFRYAFYMTNSKSTAEEVSQEVFISLLREENSYREELGDVAGFAFGIARNFIRRIERRERAYQSLSNDVSSEEGTEELSSGPETLSGQMIRNELVQRVQAAIASLPDHYRQVVVLCDLCELSYAEAASHLRCAVGTIRSRLNRAHTLLARKLEPLRGPQPNIGAAGPEGCAI